MARFVDEGNHGCHVLGRPSPVHEAAACRIRIGSVADDGNDIVDIGNRNRQAGEDMGALAGPS